MHVTCHWGRPQDMKVDVFRLKDQQQTEAAHSRNGASSNGVAASSRWEVGGMGMRFE